MYLKLASHSKCYCVIVFLYVCFPITIGSNLNLTQKSNNPFSEAHRHITNKTKLIYKTKRKEVMDRDALPPTDYYKSQFEIENSLDIELYKWAFERYSVL